MIGFISGTKYKIDIKEYDSDIFNNVHIVDHKLVGDVRKQKEKEEGERSNRLDISIIELCVNTALALITKADDYREEVKAFAQSYFDTIPFLISDKDGYLALNYENKNMLRDFSKSSRIGEIAQGINYYFAKEILGAETILDFDEYWKSLNPPTRYNGKKPDYVLIYPDGKKGLLESKGTSEADPSGYMCTGHDQCQNGIANLAKLNDISAIPFNSFVSAVSFGTSSQSPQNRRYTTLYYADPVNPHNEKALNVRLNHMYEYAKWFYFAGDENNYNRLKSGKNAVIEGRETENGIVIDSWQLHILNEEQRPITVQLGISNSLKTFLEELSHKSNSSTDMVSKTDNGSDKVKPDSYDYENNIFDRGNEKNETGQEKQAGRQREENVIYFKDGTFIVCRVD